MLQGIGRATLAPRALLISAATFSQASALRLETTTLAPCSARRCTMASPMPLVEPVTSATFPLKSKSDMGFLAGFWNFGVAILRHTRGWRQMPRFRKIWARPHDLFFLELSHEEDCPAVRRIPHAPGVRRTASLHLSLAS